MYANYLCCIVCQSLQWPLLAIADICSYQHIYSEQQPCIQALTGPDLDSIKAQASSFSSIHGLAFHNYKQYSILYRVRTKQELTGKLSGSGDPRILSLRVGLSVKFSLKVILHEKSYG